MKVFTLKWKLLSRGVADDPNITTISVKAVDENGKLVNITKKYREWMGVCTNDIQKLVDKIQNYFPKCNVQFKQLDQKLYKKVLPYFKDRLLKNKLGYSEKRFYKVYTAAPVSDVGEFFRKNKISYHDTEDWLTRIYIDMCAQNQTTEFCHKWYDVDETQDVLLKSFVLLPDAPAPVTIAAFDLETVPVDGGNRVPTGHDEHDRIVMISVCKWRRGSDAQNVLFFLNPFPSSLNTRFREFDNEQAMLRAFFEFVQDAVVITGYNINGFDTPCLFARLKFLGMHSLLKCFTSKKIGNCLVPTWSDKIAIDMYSFVQTFSSYDLPSLKLDAVAKKKLNESKVAIHPVTIHDYYCHADRLTVEMVWRDDKRECFAALKPKRVKERDFGTFLTCLEYCLQDSVLVRRLFEHEQAFRFLVERANFSALNLEDCLYFGNSRYIVEVMKTYGTLLGWFVNGKLFRNTLAEDKERLKMYFTEKGTYQGALNHCKMGQFYQDVNVYDFVSMYPSILVNQNLCFGTCDILSMKETVPECCTAVPYRVHSDVEFNDCKFQTQYTHPEFRDTDKHMMVWNNREKGFLPELVEHFISKRIEEKQLLKRADADQKIMHHNKQLNIKIFLNSMYGCMASSDAVIAYLPIAMTITAFARIYLLSSNQYFQSRGCTVAYCDTDSIFVVSNNESAEGLNEYLGQRYMSLAHEQTMKNLLVVSKKRYVYENARGQMLTKGFEKKSNELVQYLTREIVTIAMNALKTGDCDPTDGWIIWINTLIKAKLMCRDPSRHYTTRKTKEIQDYKSKSCPQYKLLKRYPHLSGQNIDFVYSQADVQVRHASDWIMLPEDCRQVDFEKIFVSQKKILVTLMNCAFWKRTKPEFESDKILHVMKWKSFVNAEFKSWLKTEKNIMILTEHGKRYTFKMS